MRLTHAFDLPAPVDQVFEVFGRLDLLAPCFPGASVWGRDIEVYHGAVKIKFGPFPLIFEGTARVVRIDVADRRMVVKANARDRRGVAAGAARVTATFRAVGADVTTVQVLTELDLTGRPAQLGTGVIASVSERLKEQFVSCIGAKLAAGLTAEQPAGASGAGTAGASANGSVGQAGDASGRDGAADATHALAGADAGVTASVGSAPPTYDYSPPSESTPHLQVLPDVARTWLPWLASAAVGLSVLVFAVRWLRRR